MIYLAGAGWTMFALAVVLLHLDYRDYEKQLEGKENALDIWRNEANRLTELVLDRESAIAHMHMEIEALTPRRNARGKFVGRHEEL